MRDAGQSGFEPPEGSNPPSDFLNDPPLMPPAPVWARSGGAVLGSINASGARRPEGSAHSESPTSATLESAWLSRIASRGAYSVELYQA